MLKTIFNFYSLILIFTLILPQSHSTGQDFKPVTLEQVALQQFICLQLPASSQKHSSWQSQEQSHNFVLEQPWILIKLKRQRNRPINLKRIINSIFYGNRFWKKNQGVFSGISGFVGNGRLVTTTGIGDI